MPRLHAATTTFVLLVLTLANLPAWAQDRGGITGKVFDKKTSHAIPFATVTVVGTQKGGLTDSEGRYRITGLAPGTYEVRFQFLGYSPVNQTGVVVAAGKTLVLDVAMQDIVVREEKAIEVTAERRLMDQRQGATVRSASAAEIRNMPVSTVSDVLQKQAGVSVEADQIYVRGGRPDETVFLVGGVANRDAVTGQSSAVSLNARSVAELSVATGAFDVRYGNALAGVVDIKLKEGGDRFAGGLTTGGASYGGRSVQMVLGGPLGWAPMKKGTMHWIVDLNADQASSRFPSIDKLSGGPRLRSSYRDGIFGKTWTYGDFFAPSADNRWAGRAAVTWKPNGSDRWKFDVSKRISIDQGYSRTFITATGDVGDPAYPWRWSRRIDHAPVIFEDNVQIGLNWRRTLAATGYVEAQISRYYSAQREEVMGKTGDTPWQQYEPPDDIGIYPPGDPRRSDWYWDSGDANKWQDRRTITNAFSWGLTKRLKRHELEAGFEHQAQTAQFVTIEDPWIADIDGLGSAHDIWRVHPWVGDFFVRDRLEYEGFTANVGLRTDYWFLGREAERTMANLADTINITPTTREQFFENTHSFFGRRYKLKVSPRIMVAHPIGTNSSFFFNYGQFTQNPRYQYVYARMGSTPSDAFSLLGNLDLNPEIAIKYEVGGRNEFRRGAAVNATFYVNDRYDYPIASLLRRTQGSTLVSPYVYINGHFTRTRGFEVEVEKRRGTGVWSGKVSYSYEQTKGKSSDANEAKVAEISQLSAAESRLSQIFVRSNRPHKVTADFDLRFRDEGPLGWSWLEDSGLNLSLQGRSGRAFTPVAPVTLEDSGEPNSRNGPFQITFDLKVNRQFRIAGQRFDFAVAGTNIFNNPIVNRVDRVTGQGRAWGIGEYAPEVFAGIINPIDRARAEQWSRESEVDDPANFGPKAQWKVTLDYDF